MAMLVKDNQTPETVIISFNPPHCRSSAPPPSTEQKPARPHLRPGQRKGKMRVAIFPFNQQF